MHAAARLTDARGQPLFQRRLAVFVSQLDAPLTVRVFLRNRRADQSESACRSASDSNFWVFSISACAMDACTS